jgi:deazaflavin-dependent oxidoreductase (nitroreductase family)
MPAASRNIVTETLFRMHPTIYRRTGGKVGGKMGKLPILLLNTRGRKSGLPRTNGLMYTQHGDSWAVAASWAGEPKHPLWYLNLVAEPDVTIEIDGKEVPVRARELEGEERDEVWQKIVAQDDGFAVYEERTRGIREIPVILLERRPVRILYGMRCSYFTGKLEAYFQTKGIPFHFVEMHRTQFKACAEATGITQLPCTQEPDGSWLTDTTRIIEHFEAADETAPVTPGDPAAAFCSRLFEDLFDEWYWRPALYYRWAHPEDARLMSSEIASQLLRDVPLPLFLRRWFILFRQRSVYLKKDGVTAKTAPVIEKLYLDSLTELDAIFAKRPFLFGERPCEADFGMFGPFFRHFFCDPTSGMLMRERAPNLLNWVTRLWKTRPDDLIGASAIQEIPEDLDFFFNMISEDYLPYLAANAQAVANGEDTVRYHSQGVDWTIPTAPYRAQCLNDLRRSYADLDGIARTKVNDLLSDSAVDILQGSEVPIAKTAGILGRLGRPSGNFG